MQYNFAAVCVNPCYVKLARQTLGKSSVRVASVIDFPLGSSTTESKVFITKTAIEDGAKEIDMVIEQDGELHPIEIKKSVKPESKMITSFGVLDKGSVPRGKGAIICMRPELSAVNSDVFIVPIWMI